ncbi:MAG: fibronectin type III domain-containing protein [Candidatus Nanopelagicales bacterium]|nr:fibronectin type III domain-containing protein [Candidatus Nanopelagicales bacterium]
MNRIALLASAALASAVVCSTTPAMGATIAQEPAPAVIAVDQTPAITQVLANRINAITVSGTDSGIVAVSAAGHTTRTARVRAGQSVTITDLDPGYRYTVTLDGRRIGFATPVAQVGAATGLRVETTDVAGQAQLTWGHVVNKGEGVPVSYTVAAVTSASSTPVTKAVTTDLHATLSGLNLNERYTFTVTPANSASTGRVSTATMHQTLAQIAGVTGPQSAPVPVAAPAPAAPAAAPAPAPAAPAAPATRTIEVCPAGYADAGAVCQKSLPYTFHAVTLTSPYTYHQAFIQTGSHVDYSASPNGGTYYAADQWNPNDGSAAGYYAVIPDGYTTSVKDAAPSGWTDSGTAWVRTDQVKDAAPAGYTDSGTAWVATAAKVTQAVPA